MTKIELLKQLDNLYFNEDNSPLTDTEYDKLRTEAKKEFPNDDYWNQVGAKIDSKFEKIKLPFVMGGLEEFNPETVSTWLEKENDDIVAAEKLDGNSIGCSFEDYLLSFAASRGDGSEGQNIINKIKYTIPKLPIMNITDKISLRGEVLLKGDLFKKFDLKNRRNSVGGILRRDLIDPSVLSKLTVVFYELIEAPWSKIINMKTEVDRLEFIKKALGFDIVRYIVLPKDLPTDKKIETLVNFLVHVKETANYDIDGLVLTRNNSARENVMHVKNKIKFKVNQAAVKCKYLGIEWNVTRLGYIKPVVLIEPTEILGVTVSRCSGFNYSFIVSNFIGENSIIGVTRAGDVIPFITEVYEQAGVIYTPTDCPSCKSKLEFTYDDDGNEVDLKCVSDQCPQKLIYQVSHFFVTIGVDGLSDKTFKNIGITSIPVIYTLTMNSFKNLPGFGEKKAKKVIDEVKKTLLTTPTKLLAAFGIPLIGKTLSKQLCSKFTIDQLFEITDPDVLGLGPITSKTLIDNLPKYRDLYDFLKSIGLEFEKEDKSLKTLNGMRFALTGEGPLKRAELQKLIESKGGEVRGIGKETMYLVSDNPSSTSGKMKEAKKYGTQIIDYDALLTMLK